MRTLQKTCCVLSEEKLSNGLRGPGIERTFARYSARLCVTTTLVLHSISRRMSWEKLLGDALTGILARHPTQQWGTGSRFLQRWRTLGATIQLLHFEGHSLALKGHAGALGR